MASERKTVFMLLLLASVVIGFVLLGLAVASFTGGEPGEVDLTVYARQYAFEPAVIKVNRGDDVSINLITRDVTHGFFLEGYDIDAKVKPQDSSEYSTLYLRHPSEHEDYQVVDRIEFKAGKTGKFRFRCSQTCGYMHPFMQGELIVLPNYSFWSGVGLCVGVAVATLMLVVSRAMSLATDRSSNAAADLQNDSKVNQGSADES